MKFVFFTDRDLGKRFPQILAAAGLLVERHDDLFPPDCPDETWLEYAGKHRRIAVTHNLRIRYMPNEIGAVNRHAVALLVVVGKAPYKDLAENFVATASRIEAFLDQHNPTIYGNVRAAELLAQRLAKAYFISGLGGTPRLARAISIMVSMRVNRRS